MPETFRAPIGTQDVLPPASARWQALIATLARVTERFGYGLVHGPLFEDLAVFQRLGVGTDVVRREMYDFRDKGDRHLALRPEATASVVRAFVQHRPPTPWKVWCVTPVFRYERPQAGRLRQHHQVDVEAIGVADPDIDIEIIALGAAYLDALGLRRCRLVLNTMGTPADRVAYANTLIPWLRERAAGIPFEIDPGLVRGLDYYTHTLFEFQSAALDTAQSTVIGGGRYDGLVEQLGGSPTPGIGFGSGVERMLLACDAEGVFDEPPRALDAFVVDATDGRTARDITQELRSAGLRVDRAFGGRSMKSQMKAAGRSGARVAVIVGDQEVVDATATVRDLAQGEQQVVPRDKVADVVRKLIDPPEDR